MNKKPKSDNRTEIAKLIMSAEPFTCTQFGEQSEIEGYVPSLKQWLTFADIHSIGNFDSEDLASFMTEALHEYAAKFVMAKK